MTRPTKQEIEQIKEDLVAGIETLRAELTRDYTEPISARAEPALAHVETFCAIALRVFEKTNVSKIRDAAMTEEIKARVHGREVLE